MTPPDDTPTPRGMGSPSNSEAQPGAVASPPRPPEEEESPPYNLYFASGAIGVGLIAYVATIIVFGTELDGAALTGALGALFTLIGTVSGAYFGVKRSSDTEDKGRAAERAANERAQEGSRAARNAAGALDPQKWEDLKGRGLL